MKKYQDREAEQRENLDLILQYFYSYTLHINFNVLVYCAGMLNRFVLTPEPKCLPITPFMNDDYRCFTMLLTMCDIEFANSHLFDTKTRILQYDL